MKSYHVVQVVLLSMLLTWVVILGVAHGRRQCHNCKRMRWRRWMVEHHDPFLDWWLCRPCDNLHALNEHARKKPKKVLVTKKNPLTGTLYREQMLLDVDDETGMAFYPSDAER